MKKLMLLSLAYGTVSMAAPIFCGSQDGRYHVVVANDYRSAKVTVDGREALGGRLTCEGYEGIPEAERYKILDCASHPGADFGFQATLYHVRGTVNPVAELYEETIAGPRHVASLTCVAAMNDR